VAVPGGPLLVRGAVVAYLTAIVLIPLAAVVLQSGSEGVNTFIEEITNPRAISALKLTLLLSLGVVLVNAVAGTLIAWVLVRDDFRGKSIVNSVIDLPFALPTIVAGITLLALYGPKSPLGINIAFTQLGIMLALLFVTLPFVVRAVQPVLLELDREVELAAASLGANNFTIFRRIILPNLTPAILSGVALAFARAVGEFGSVVLIAGNLPNVTEVASLYIRGEIENYDNTGAAAVSVVLLLISVVILGAIQWFARWGARHEEAAR
jgi:sulfate transport system permease protein